jgi:hypothetical protein
VDAYQDFVSSGVGYCAINERERCATRRQHHRFHRACRNSATERRSGLGSVIAAFERDADQLEHDAGHEQHGTRGGSHAKRARRREPHQERAGYDKNETDAAPQSSSPQHKA